MNMLAPCLVSLYLLGHKLLKQMVWNRCLGVRMMLIDRKTKEL